MNRKWNHRVSVTTAIVLSMLYLVSADEETACYDDADFRRNGIDKKNCAAWIGTDISKCDLTEDNIPISDICRATCGTCTGCDDDPTFEWAGNGFDCDTFLRKDLEARCGLRQEGVLILDICRATCGTCDANATPVPTLSSVPTPTPVEVFDECFDDTTFRRNGVEKKNCVTYLKTDKKAKCNMREDGIIISDICRATCGTCTDCDDDPTFKWAGNGFDCDRFLEKDLEKRCGLRQEGILVSDICRATCDSCEVTLPVGQFDDISEKLEKYGNKKKAHPFVQVPWPHWDGPMTFDINGDGYPDMLSHHHVGSFTGKTVGGLWDLALSTVNDADKVFYTAGKVDVTYRGDLEEEITSNPDVRDKEKCTAAFLAAGEVIEEYECLGYTDFHGTVALDFDRDGKLDALVGVGGGGGEGVGLGIESMLFWGQDANRKSQLVFKGGRKNLVNAGLSSGVPQRTYGVYAADFNNDGYLDFFFINKYRKDDFFSPGHIYMNKGAKKPRQFRAHPEVSETSTAALLTDFDQDGDANEFLILERACSSFNEPFCVTKPRAKVFKWDSTEDRFTKIWSSSVFQKGTELVSSVSGDFNGDGLTDVVLLTVKDNKGKLQFWYSSGEQELLGSSTIIVNVPAECRPRHSLRSADFDLNGRVDLFVLCDDRNHVIFEQSSSGAWMPKNSTELGILSDSERNSASTSDWYKRCTGDDLDDCDSNLETLFLVKSKISERKDPIGQGVTVFDYNNDGFMDIFIAVRNGVNTLYENQGVPGNSYVSFMLKGTVSNLEAIGAIVILTWNDGVDDEDKIQLREHNAQSFESDAFGSRESRIVFGLGQTGKALKLEVRFPSGLVTTLTENELEDVPMTMNYNEITVITESAGN